MKLKDYTHYLKRSLIAAAVIIILATGGSVVYYFLYLNFDERISCRLNKDIIVINDIFTSMYLVRTAKGYIAIDTGYFSSVIEKGLQLSGIKREDVRTVFLTHSDADHTNGLNLFDSADIYISKTEYGMIKNHEQRFDFLPFFSNSLESKIYRLIDDGDVISIDGIQIRCISLPGHTYGSMGYIISEKYLFSGDAFRIKNGRIALPHKKLFVMDIEMMRSTLKKVASLKNIEYIFSAHSGFTADFEFAVSGISDF